MAQFVREFLSFNPRGWTRLELKRIVRAQPAFWRQCERNSRAYCNLMGRLIERGDIEDRDGRLYASERTRLLVVVRKELFELRTDPYQGVPFRDD